MRACNWHSISRQGCYFQAQTIRLKTVELPWCINENVSFKILAIVSVVAVLLSLLQVGIFLSQETVFGPDSLPQSYNSRFLC